MKFKEQISDAVGWHIYFMFYVRTEFDILWFYIRAGLH